MKLNIDFDRVSRESGVPPKIAEEMWMFTMGFIAENAVKAVDDESLRSKFVMPKLGWYVLDRKRMANRMAAYEAKKERFRKKQAQKHEENKREEAAPDVHGCGADNGQGSEA